MDGDLISVYPGLRWASGGARVSSLCSERVCSLAAAQAPPVADPGLWARGFLKLWCTGLVAPRHVRSSQVRDQTLYDEKSSSVFSSQFSVLTLGPHSSSLRF